MRSALKSLEFYQRAAVDAVIIPAHAAHTPGNRRVDDRNRGDRRRGFQGLLMKTLAGTPIPDEIRKRFAEGGDLEVMGRGTVVIVEARTTAVRTLKPGMRVRFAPAHCGAL